MVTINPVSLAQGVISAGGGEGNIGGRKATHWSTHLCIAGAVIGAGALATGIIINSIFIAVLGGLLLGTNVIAGWYLKKFSVFYSVDEVIQNVQGTVKDLYEQNIALNGQVRSLSGNRKEVTESRKRLEAQLKATEETNKKLSKTVAKYQQENKKLNKVIGVYQPMKQAIDQFIHEVGALDERNFRGLAAAVKALAKERARLEGGVKRLDGENRELERHGKAIENQIERLDALMQRWELEQEEMLSEMRKLTDEVNELQEQNRALDEKNHDADRIASRFEKAVGLLRNEIDVINRNG